MALQFVPAPQAAHAFRRRHRHLPPWPLRRLPARGPPACCRRTRLRRIRRGLRATSRSTRTDRAPPCRKPLAASNVRTRRRLGQYADNLVHFLHQLGGQVLRIGSPARRRGHDGYAPGPGRSRAAIRNVNKESTAPPFFGSQKSDPRRGHCAAARIRGRRATCRHASSRPRAGASSVEVAGTLAGRRPPSRTRLINQLHHPARRLPSPRLALLTKDPRRRLGPRTRCIVGPTAAGHLAGGFRKPISENIAYLPAPARTRRCSKGAAVVDRFLERACRQGTRSGDQVLTIGARRRAHARNAWKNCCWSTSTALPDDNFLATIQGIGDVHRRRPHRVRPRRRALPTTPGKLVAYFGVLPIEVAGGDDRDGKSRGPRRFVMSFAAATTWSAVLSCG